MRPVPNRYNTDGPWFKGNTHIHTTRSDGGKDARTAAAMYAGRGYHFIFITDHNRPAEVEAMTGLPLLALNGVEIDGKDETGAWFHAVGLGHDGEAPQRRAHRRADRLPAPARRARRARPPVPGAATRPRMRCATTSTASRSTIISATTSTAILRRLPLGPHAQAQPAHPRLRRRRCPHEPGNEPWDGAVVVSAPSLSKENVLASLHAGNFYATLGPRFESIHVSASHVYVRTSPVPPSAWWTTPPGAGVSWPPTTSPSPRPTSTSKKSTPTCVLRSRTPSAVAPGPTP